MFFLFFFNQLCVCFSAAAPTATALECSITKDCNQSQYYGGVCLIVKLETRYNLILVCNVFRSLCCFFFFLHQMSHSQGSGLYDLRL